MDDTAAASERLDWTGTDDVNSRISYRRSSSCKMYNDRDCRIYPEHD